MPDLQEVTGTFTLRDGEQVQFRIAVPAQLLGPQDWTVQQWGNTERVLGRTVDALTAMADGLFEELVWPDPHRAVEDIQPRESYL